MSKNKHVRHIQHYVATCSIGDWFVLYQVMVIIMMMMMMMMMLIMTGFFITR